MIASQNHLSTVPFAIVQVSVERVSIKLKSLLETIHFQLIFPALVVSKLSHNDEGLV